MENRQFFLNHSKIDILFNQSPDTFIVKEIPLYDFSNSGEHLILEVRKKNISTWDMIKVFAKFLNIKEKEFGYAGLKDKNALTYQYISINKKYEKLLENFENSNIKIISKTYHNNKIKIGHLKGNRFFIRFKKVDGVSYTKIKSILELLYEKGFPNYFGYQRFGIDKNNHIKGKEILDGKKERNIKLRKMFLSAYQSYLFNLWLSERIKLSKIVESFSKKELKQVSSYPFDLVSLKEQKQFLKILKGDILSHYPYGKIFYIDEVLVESEKFLNKDRVLTGPLIGKKVKLAKDDGAFFENFKKVNIDGGRRFAWVWLEDLEYKYIDDKAWFEFSFYLPKGSYATTLIEEIIH